MTDGPCEVTSADISPKFQPCRPPAIRVITQARLGTWFAAKGLITGAGGHFLLFGAVHFGLKCAT